jgi:hypothetical protein
MNKTALVNYAHSHTDDDQYDLAKAMGDDVLALLAVRQLSDVEAMLAILEKTPIDEIKGLLSELKTPAGQELVKNLAFKVAEQDYKRSCEEDLAIELTEELIGDDIEE